MADASIAASIKAGVSQIIADTSIAVTFNGNAYSAGTGTASDEQGVDQLGYVTAYMQTITILTDDLTANGDAPAVGDQVTVGGTVRRIAIITTTCYGEVTRLSLQELN